MDFGFERPKKDSVAATVTSFTGGLTGQHAVSIPEKIQGFPKDVEACHGNAMTKQWEGLLRFKSRTT